MTSTAFIDRATNIQASWLNDVNNFVYNYGKFFINVKEFGAHGDGVTDDTAAIQAAINFVANRTAGTKSRTLFFPDGTYMTSAPLVIFPGMCIEGSGNTSDGGVNTFGSRIKPKTGFVGSNLIVYDPGATDPSWQWGKLSNMVFLGNGAIDGVHMQGFGETSVVERCMFDGFINGLYATGNMATLTVINSTFNGNTYGVNLDGVTSTARFLGISGDTNNSLMRIKGGLSTNVSIVGLKAENYTAGKGDPVILVDDLDGGTVNIMGGWCDTNAPRNDVIKLQKTTATNNPQINVIGLHANGMYTNLINDTINTKTLPLSGSSITYWNSRVDIGGAEDLVLENGRSIRAKDSVGTLRAILIPSTANDTQVRAVGSGGLKLQGSGSQTNISINSDGSQLGFYGGSTIAKPTVTGAKGGNAALTSLLTQLAALGLITDSTT